MSFVLKQIARRKNNNSGQSSSDGSHTLTHTHTHTLMVAELNKEYKRYKLPHHWFLNFE